MADRDITVSVLGMFEVRRAGVPARLTGRPATLLAALTLNLGTAVPFGVLTKFLWPDGTGPAEPRRTIQTYASRLRDVVGRSAVVAHMDALRLDLDRDCVDLYRFRDLVNSPDGHQDELDRLTEALALWRGAPLSGLAPDALTAAERPGIVEELLAATERANELRLRLGLIDDAFLVSLRRLVSEHPWRERSWGHLMLALYRRERQAEALTAFGQLVTVLREDLGIDPGIEVAHLYQRILARDPELLERDSQAAESGSRLPPPAQLPAGSRTFVGRQREIEALHELLGRPADRVRVAVVSGPAGVGKTTTAVEAAHRVRSAFPDGQLFATGASGAVPIPAHDILGGFVRDLGLGSADIPSQPEERAALFRSICAQRRLLVVIDDVHSASQVEALLPGTGGSAVLVTSRRQLSITANLHLDLGVMSQGESHDLLAAIVGPDRLIAEPEATTAILESCAGSPLAVRILGGRLAVRRAWPVAHLADRMAGSDRLAELSHDGQSVRAALEATVHTLDPDRAACFHALSAMPVHMIDIDAAAALWRVGRAEAHRRLEGLCDVRLLESEAPDLYTWHDLIGHYLRAQSDPPAWTQRQVVRQAIRSLANAKDLLRPDDRPHHPTVLSIKDVDGVVFGDHADVHSWLHPRMTMFVQLARSGLAAGGDHAVEAASMSVLIDVVADECCQPEDGSESLLRAVIDADLPSAGAHFAAAALHNLAVTMSSPGRFPEAKEAAYRAVAAWRRLGDRYGEVVMHNNLANMHSTNGSDTAARDLLRTCVDACDVLPASLRARCMINLVYVHERLGEVADAQRWLTAARALSQPAPTSFDAGNVLIATAHVHLAAGDATASMAAAEEALSVARRMKSSPLVVRSLVVLARARRTAGLDSSTVAAEAARTNFSWRRDDLWVRAEALVELAHAHHVAADHASYHACAAEASRMLDRAGLCRTTRAKALLDRLP